MVESVEYCFDTIFVWDIEVKGFDVYCYLLLLTSIVIVIIVIVIGVLSNMDMR